MVRVIEGDLQGQGVKVSIVVSRFNGFITDRLLEGRWTPSGGTAWRKRGSP